jgi:hypothetical protein
METIKVNEKAEEKQEKKFKISKTVWNVIFWVVLAILAFVWIFDFVRVRKEEEPYFCVSRSTLTYNDGTVDRCIGLGYKVYRYHRSSINAAVEFVPFWVGPQE